MRKLGYVLVLIFILVILVLAVPFIDGYRFKDKYLKLLASISERNPIKINVVEYNLGWLNSNAILTLDLNPPGTAPDPSKVITFNQHISHGPLVVNPNTDGHVIREAVIDTQIHLDKNIETLLGSAAAGGIMQVITLVSFNDRYENHFKTPLINLTQGPFKLNWEGVQGVLTADFIDLKMKYSKLDASTGLFSLAGPGVNISMQPLTTQAERTCEEGLPCSGHSTFKFPGGTGMIQDTNVNLNSLDGALNYGVQDGSNFNFDYQVNLKKLEIPGYVIGPASIKILFKNLNSNSIKKISDLLRSSATLPEGQREAQQLVILAELNKEAPRLITPNTSLDQKVNINTSYGNLILVSKLFWPANTPLPTSSTDLAKLNFNLNLRAAVTLVNQILTLIESNMTPELSAKLTQTTPTPAPVVTAEVQKTITTEQSTTDITAENLAHQLLDTYVQEKKVTPEAVSAVIDLHKKNLSPLIYGASIDKLLLSQNLPKEVAEDISRQLKEQYSATYTDTPVATTSTVTTTTAPAISTPPVSQNVTVRGQFESFIKQGFIVQDKSDYVVSIIYENGELKINNVIVPLTNDVTTASIH